MALPCATCPVTVRKWCLITSLRWRFRFCAGSTSLMPICAAACGIMHARARSGSAAVACSASSAWGKSSLHTALTPETHHLINAERLALMKPDAVLVNTARGAVVDTVALAQALCEDKLWGAGLDVFEQEQPFDFDHPIMKAPHTVLSAHAAYWSEESGRELRERAMQAAIDAVQGRIPVDCLNPCVFDSSAR